MSSFDFLALISVKTAILSVAVLFCWCVLRIFSLRSPTLHRFAWGGVLLLGVFGAGFHVTFSVPTLPKEVTNEFVTINHAEPPVSFPEMTPQFLEPNFSEQIQESNDIHVAVPVIHKEPNREKTPQISLPSAATCLVAVWIGGVAFLVLRSSAQYGTLLRKLSGTKTVTGADTLQWQNLLEEYGIMHKKISLLLSQEIGPALVRTFRGTAIVVPENLWEEAEPKIKDGILRHELAHYRHRDLLVCGVIRFAAMVHWFNPLAHFAVRKFEQATEWACDIAAFAHHVQGERHFAEAMLAIHEAVPSVTLHRFAFGGGKLSQRAKLLNEFITKPREKTMKKVTVTTITLFVLLLGIINIRFVAQEMKSKNTSSALIETYDKAITDSQNPTMTLTILDPDGKPIPGATGKTHRFDRNKQRIFKGFTADENGKAVFEIPQKSNIGTFTFTVQTPEFTPFHGRWEMENNPGDLPAACSVKLERGKTVGGVVHDENGQPVADVKVEFSFPLGRHTNSADISMGCSCSANTDAQGRWKYTSLPKDVTEMRSGLTMLHKDFMPTSVEDVLVSQVSADANGNYPFVSMIRRGLRFSGIVQDSSGKAIEGAKMEMEFLDVNGGSEQRYRKTVSDGQGNFLFENCPASQQAVLFGSALGFAGQYLKTSVSVDVKPVTLTLPAEKPLRLKIVDTNGKPIRNASAWISAWGPFGGYGDILSYMLRNENNWNAQIILPVDDQGVWTWNSAPLGPMTMTVTAPGFMGQQINVEGGKEMKTVTLTTALLITGTVVDDTTGKAIPEFTVTEGLVWDKRGPAGEINDGPNWQTQRASKERGGTFSCAFERPEFQRMFRVEAEGYHPCDSRRIKSEEGGVTLEFRMKRLGAEELARLAKARSQRSGRVLDPQGNAAVDATVVYATNSSTGGIGITMPHAAGFEYRSVKTDTEGRFTLPSIELDEKINECYAFVVIHANGFIRVEQEEFEKTYNIAVNHDAPAVRLEPWAQIEGTLMIGSKPALDKHMDLSFIEEEFPPTLPRIGFHYFGQSDEKGRFVFRRVVPGRYRLAHAERIRLGNGMSTGYSVYSKLVSAESGEKKVITLGGTGRAVVGRIETTPELKKLLEQGNQRAQISADVPRPKYDELEIPAQMQAIRDKFEAEVNKVKGDPEKVKAVIEAFGEQQKKWMETEEGQKFMVIAKEFQEKERDAAQAREKVVEQWRIENAELLNSSFAGAIKKDGSFRIEDVPAGNWTLRVDLYPLDFEPKMQGVAAAIPKSFTIQETPAEPFDIGVIEVKER